MIETGVFVSYFCISLSQAFTEKIGDIASVVGVRDNQLIGYGLVIGLNGTGDKSGLKIHHAIHF